MRPIKNVTNPPSMRPFTGLVIVAVIALAALIYAANSENVQVPAGYAAYIIETPIIGTTTFKEVITGPSSTGRQWRVEGDRVSITPYSYTEEFDKNSLLIAKDKLPIVGSATIVWRIKSSQKDIRAYMEGFGGLDEKHTTDESARFAYDNYIKQPFATLIREEFASFNGLEVNEHTAAMGDHVSKELAAMLKDTPFEVVQVVIGKAQPPESVLDQISLKVAKQQELERKATEQSIADAELKIQQANGAAEGAKALALATARAEANLTLSKSLTPELLQYNAIENMKGAERIYIPVGANGLPIVTTVPDSQRK